MSRDTAAPAGLPLVVAASRVKTLLYWMMIGPFGLFALWAGLSLELSSLSLWGRVVSAIVASAGVLSTWYALWRCLFPPVLIVDHAGLRIEGGMWWTDRPVPWSDVKSVDVWSLGNGTEIVYVSCFSSRYRLPLKCWKMSSPDLQRRIEPYRQRATTG